MKKSISIILAGLLLLVMCACSTQPTLVSPGTTAPAGGANNTAPAENSSIVFKPGDTAAMNNITVNFVGVQTSTGSEYNTPADGKVFVLCEFEITNNGTADLAVSSIMNFQAYCDDYACEYSLGALMAKGDSAQLDGTVAPGKKMKGIIGYELPIEWQELEIIYTPDILSDSKFQFVAANS